MLAQATSNYTFKLKLADKHFDIQGMVAVWLGLGKNRGLMFLKQRHDNSRRIEASKPSGQPYEELRRDSFSFYWIFEGKLLP